MPLSLPEQLAHSTVRIECTLSDGTISTGTGFFYSLNKTENTHIPVIITNKHVVEGAQKGRFLLTLKDEHGNPKIGSYKRYELDSFEKRWMPHPDNSVDLCMMPIGSLINETEKKNTLFFCTKLDQTLIPSAAEIEDMAGLENVTMIGYPNGLWDEKNNLPIFRRGVLATDYKYDWNGKKEFLIDAACFPGSSGSPVMLFEMGGYITKTKNIIGDSRFKLLGILYAGPQHTVAGDVKVVPVPTLQKVISVSGIPNNLGIIIKAEQLRVFEGMIT